MNQTAWIVLEDGSCYEGYAFGAQASSYGEVVFNTSMTGYQEVLTDPSYAGQIVVLTYPMVGNYGISPENIESSKIQVRGLVVREECDAPSHWSSQGTLAGFLASQGHHVQVAAGKTHQDRDFGNTRLYSKIVLTCDQTNGKLVASKSVMGLTTLTTATVGAGLFAQTLDGNSVSALELERFLCTQLGGVKFTNLTGGAYQQTETIPATFSP
ncbi:MAG: hypothetical protein IIB11_06460 [Chloroflexi bacterium]|nr:hypothetical protein [Chloroflexota bacterium]